MDIPVTFGGSQNGRLPSSCARLLHLALRVAAVATCLVGALVSTVAQAGQTVVVVLDDSGSMDKFMDSRVRRMAAAKQSLASVLRGLPRDTKVGVLTLNSTVKGSHWILPIGSPDADRWSPLLEQVRAKGGTPLGEFLKEGADELLKLRAQEPFDTYRLLVVTDGEATDAPYLASILPDVVSRGVNLDVIGVAMKEQHSLAQSAHTYRSAEDAQSLTQALTEVFAETGGDDQAAQADFDLISGMPDDVAAELVKGLSTPRNDPISVLQFPTDNTAAANAPNFPNVPGSPPNAAQPKSGLSSVVSALLSTICCFGSFCFILLIVISIVLNAVKNHTKS